MRNPRLIPYETIVQATAGEREAIERIMQHYRGYIRRAALVNGTVNQDAEDFITETLLAALFKYRFDEK